MSPQCQVRKLCCESLNPAFFSNSPPSPWKLAVLPSPALLLEMQSPQNLSLFWGSLGWLSLGWKQSHPGRGLVTGERLGDAGWCGQGAGRGQHGGWGKVQAGCREGSGREWEGVWGEMQAGEQAVCGQGAGRRTDRESAEEADQRQEGIRQGVGRVQAGQRAGSGQGAGRGDGAGI